MAIVKYILFIFNLLFAISGIGLIVAGAIVLSDVTDFQHFTDSKFLAPPIVLIVVGAIVFFVASLGCYGAIKESYGLLITFAVCLLLIFIAELAVGIVAALYKADFNQALKSTLRQSMANYSTSDLEKIAWDKVQTKLMCCGVDSPNDWQSQTLPTSCCYSEGQFSDSFSQYCISQAAGKYRYEIGCYNRIEMKINENTNILIGVGIGIAFVEIIGIILACWLAHSITEHGK